MKKNCRNPFKPLSVLSFFLILVFIASHIIFKTQFTASVIPHPLIITVCIYSICCFFCVLCSIKIKLFHFYYIGLELLCAINILNGNYLIGFIFMIFLFTLFSIVKFTKKWFFFLILFSCLVINSGLCLFLGLQEFYRFLSLSIIFAILYYIISNLIKELYTGKDIQPKSILKLKDLDLSERQLFCLNEVLSNNSTLKEIAEKCLISESVIKKEMQIIYDKTGVSTKEELHYFLSTNLVEL